MNGYSYEYFVADYLRQNGYFNVEVTKASGDYGVDVTAFKNGYKYAVQCKYYTNPIGLKAVQEVVAGKSMYNCDKTIVITNSTFTKAAQELAQNNDVLLIGNLSPQSQVLTQVQTERHKSKKETAKYDFKYKRIMYSSVLLKSFIAFLVIMIIVSMATDNNTIFSVLFFGLIFAFVVFSILYFIGFDKVKHFYRVHKPCVVIGNLTEFKQFKQTNKANKDLKVSQITGLPHLFTIEGQTYDIDDFLSIYDIPDNLNYNPIVINGTKYSFTNYLRLCAKLYKKNGYKENTKALQHKIADIETRAFNAKELRKKARIFVRLPKQLNLTDNYNESYKDDDFIEKIYNHLNTHNCQVSFPDVVKIVELNLITLSGLHKEINCGYANSARIINELEASGFIKRQKEKSCYLWKK